MFAIGHLSGFMSGGGVRRYDVLLDDTGTVALNSLQHTTKYMPHYETSAIVGSVATPTASFGIDIHGNQRYMGKYHNLYLHKVLSDAGWNGSDPVYVVITVEASVYVGDHQWIGNDGGATVSYGGTVTVPAAIVIDDLPVGSRVEIINDGYIIGGGGFGAPIAPGQRPSGVAGSVGGTAIMVRANSTPIKIINNGVIAGGGGGGGSGGGGNCGECYDDIGGGGGGGAGLPAGFGGSLPNAGNGIQAPASHVGSAGTVENGGDPGEPSFNGISVEWNWGADGGLGGDLGMPGAPGASAGGVGTSRPPGPGGLAGIAISGYTKTNVTYEGSGDLLGRIT